MPPKTSKRAPSTRPADPPLDAARRLADAMCRAATECVHQHDRFSRLLMGETTLETEELAAQEICSLCDHTLAELASSYERTVGPMRPAAPEEVWRRVHALWLASRDYAQRHTGCDELTRKLRGRHTPQELWQLEIEYELEASALLALRQACDAYRKLTGASG